jgi:hypothetical protein
VGSGGAHPCAINTGARGDNGIYHNKNPLRFPYVSEFSRSHSLHPHPYAGVVDARHNGKAGRIVGWVPQLRKYRVALAGPREEKILLKPANLEACLAEGADQADTGGLLPDHPGLESNAPSAPATRAAKIRTDL